jgi:hypothetical protein
MDTNAHEWGARASARFNARTFPSCSKVSTVPALRTLKRPEGRAPFALSLIRVHLCPFVVFQISFTP